MTMSGVKGDDSADVNAPASPVCYVSEYPGYFAAEAVPAPPPIAIDAAAKRAAQAAQTLVPLLNALLEAERAGARVLAILLRDAPLSSPLQTLLLRVRDDEAANAIALNHAIRRIGGNASTKLGDFVQKTLAIDGMVPRLQFVNRGQAWVARKINDALPHATDEATRTMLLTMRESHLENIAQCDALIAAAGG